MATRRQEKVARVIKEAVSDAIAHHLSDPRIEGFVSVTRVDVAPDMHNADVYLSIFGNKEADQNKTFAA
ncbi:MAG: ribosome-binding factor A, partial [Planctomycetota bacterium]|nr:ribosome-binding factor A [Planctomycetota bacterium]